MLAILVRIQCKKKKDTDINEKKIQKLTNSVESGKKKRKVFESIENKQAEVTIKKRQKKNIIEAKEDNYIKREKNTNEKRTKRKVPNMWKR